ncbi:MAG: glycosyltransferase family 4 protein [Planctomycetes bacterium]|nr:glycosyltransferase family 4 protein [Planctomycetota bacterium]
MEDGVAQRVLCVTAETKVCEETRYLVRLVDGLRGRGHEVLCFVPEGGSRVAEALAARRWWGLGGWLGRLLFQGEWVRAAADFQPTVIHACGWRALGPARVLAAALAAPCVVSLFEVPRRRLTVGVPMAFAVTHAELAERLRARLPGGGGHVEVIVPGVPVPEEQEPSQDDDHLPVVGTVTELHSTGEVQLLFRAAGLLEERGVHCEYVVMGEGRREHRLRQLARRLGIRGRTHFLTPMLAPERVLAELDVAVVLSRRRLRLLSILEAQVVGTAVLAGEVPGVEEFVEDGVSGRLLTEATPVALAGLLSELIEDRQLRQSLGQQGRQQARRSASLVGMLEAVERLYASVGAGSEGETP